MEMYDALKCPEDEISSTTVSLSTTTVSSQDYEPKVIIKDPVKMMEDILNSINVADVEVDSNRLDEVEAQKKMDFDVMMGDQPSEAVDEDKKTLLKLSDKKETFPKKQKKKSEQLKVKDDEQMQGDAPAEEANAEQNLITTTDRQRRDANLIETTTANLEISTTELPVETTSVDDLSSSISSSELPTTVEQITEESTTKFIVQGHPPHMSQAIFKDPILPDVNNTHERIEIGESEDRFVPPMLLVKAKTTTTTTTEGIVKEDKESTIDASTSSSTDQTLIDVTDIIEKSSEAPAQLKEETIEVEVQTTTESQSENTITPLVTSEKPINIEKRNDPRLGLKVTSTGMNTQQSSTIVSDELISTTDSSSPSSIDESSLASAVTTEEIFDSTSVSPDTSETSIVEAETIATLIKIADAEKLVAAPLFVSDTQPSTVEIVSTTTPKSLEITHNKSTTAMRNDINAHHQSDDSSEEEEDSREHHHPHNEHHEHHDENKFSNAEDFQPYKPNRHRTISKPDHHHGPGFSLGKILG